MKSKISNIQRECCCTCAFKDSKDSKTVSPDHDKSCQMFISKRILNTLRRRLQAFDKFKDPRDHELYKLASRRLKIKRKGKNWVICYRGRGTVSGLVPDLMPFPMPRRRELDPERIYAQIRGALVNFALEVLNDSRFEKKRNQ